MKTWKWVTFDGGGLQGAKSMTGSADYKQPGKRKGASQPPSCRENEKKQQHTESWMALWYQPAAVCHCGLCEGTGSYLCLMRRHLIERLGRSGKARRQDVTRNNAAVPELTWVGARNWDLAALKTQPIHLIFFSANILSPPPPNPPLPTSLSQTHCL